jgi:SAM-dependent methyltransferase
VKAAESMRRDWDKRARKDAFYYIASWRKDWDEASFLRSGEDDYEKFVKPALERQGFSPRGKTMLELGCGAGRMTRVFAREFSGVQGFDVSSEMLDRARALHRGIENITWVQGNGTDLSPVPTASVDFVFSYLVLQHLPAEVLVHSYIREILRVLTDGGVCLFQFNGTAEKYMNWKGRAIWGVVDALWSANLPGASRSAAKLLGLDPEMAGKSWHGAGVRSENVAATIRASAASVLELSGEDTPMAWCCARKSS